MENGAQNTPLFPLWHGVPAPAVPSRGESLLTALIPWELVHLLAKVEASKGYLYFSTENKNPYACPGFSLEKLRMVPIHPEEKLCTEQVSDPWHSADH